MRKLLKSGERGPCRGGRRCCVFIIGLFWNWKRTVRVLSWTSTFPGQICHLSLANVSQTCVCEKCWNLKDSTLLTWLFLLMPIFIDCATGLTEGEPLTKVHTSWSDWIWFLIDKGYGEESNGPRLSDLEEHVKLLKEVMKWLVIKIMMLCIICWSFVYQDQLMEDHWDAWSPEAFGIVAVWEICCVHQACLQREIEEIAFNKMGRVEVMDATTEERRMV